MSDADAGFTEQRLRVIREGVVEAIRVEVQRRRDLGLPIYVSRNGTVVDINVDHARPLGVMPATMKQSCLRQSGLDAPRTSSDE